MTRAELAQLLRHTAEAVASGDSAEGRVQWLLGATYDELVVDAAIRTGNLDGQGGYILIDEAKLPRAADSDGDDLDDAERAELHRELEASIAEADAGDTEDFATVLARLRER